MYYSLQVGLPFLSLVTRMLAYLYGLTTNLFTLITLIFPLYLNVTYTRRKMYFIKYMRSNTSKWASSDLFASSLLYLIDSG